MESRPDQYYRDMIKDMDESQALNNATSAVKGCLKIAFDLEDVGLLFNKNFSGLILTSVINELPKSV